MPGVAASGAGMEAVLGLGEKVSALVEQYIAGGWRYGWVAVLAVGEQQCRGREEGGSWQVHAS